MRWHISQIGARQHYAVPRALMQHDELAAFYTEIWWPWRSKAMMQLGRPLRRLAGRWHGELANAAVHHYTFSSLLRSRTFPKHDAAKRYQWFMDQGRWFAMRVAKQLHQSNLDPKRDAFFGFASACLETLQTCNDLGIVSIQDQIDPGPKEDQIVAEERKRRPGWEPAGEPIPQQFFDRLHAEWDTAKRVLVNSDWSRQALIEQGVAAQKIIVVPLAYQPSAIITPGQDKPQQDKVKVLWLGSVNLRKGIGYLIDAAQQLLNEPVEIIVAGPIRISQDIVAQAPANMRFVGQVPRLEAQRYFESADLFVLPTLSDGFAITQLEAMANGLPVITTDRCGKVVDEGIDGKLIPAADVNALAHAIAALAADGDLRKAMSLKAREKAGQFTLDRYGRAVKQAVQEIL